MTLYRHKKRGSTYEEITHFASLQCSAAPEFEEMFDDDNWTVYRDVKTNAIYIRPTAEFMDGRFEVLPSPQGTEDSNG
jgi:hypothetical protein